MYKHKVYLVFLYSTPSSAFYTPTTKLSSQSSMLHGRGVQTNEGQSKGTSSYCMDGRSCLKNDAVIRACDDP